MKRIITDTVKRSKGRGRNPGSNMALLSSSRFRKKLDYVISIYKVTILDFMVQTRAKHLRIPTKGRAIKIKRDQEFQYHFYKQNRVPHPYLRAKVLFHLGRANPSS